MKGCLYLVLYFVVCASIALIARLKIKINDEVFRKILHCILLGSLSVWIFVFDTWWMVSLTSLIFAILVYPILHLAERIKGYSKTMTERKKGELKSSLLIVFFMFSCICAICYGYFHDRLLALICIYAWGFGDAAAALIGKKYGTHKIFQSKSLEGTIAMFSISLMSVFILLIIRGNLNIFICLFISIVVALVSTLSELFTPNGLDTITCPFCAMITLLPLLTLFGGLS